MKILIAQSHPSYESFSEAILQVVLESLEQTDAEVSLVRVGKQESSSILELEKPDLLVLIYPTWWGGYPASLLHWIQDSLMLGNGMLANVQKVISVSTHGSSKLVNIVQGEWGKAYTERKLLPLCKNNVQSEWLSLYKIDRQRPQNLETFLEEVSKSFARLNEDKVIRC